MYGTFSRIFEKDVSKEMGLKLVVCVLSHFLCKAFISENFNELNRIVDLATFKTLVVRVQCFSAETFINMPRPLIIRKLLT